MEEFSPLVELSDFSQAPQGKVIKVVAPHSIRSVPAMQAAAANELAIVMSETTSAKIKMSQGDGLSLQAAEDCGLQRGAIDAQLQSEATRRSLKSNNGYDVDFNVVNTTAPSNWSDNLPATAPPAPLRFTEDSYKYTSIYDNPPSSSGTTMESSGYVISEYKSIYDS